MNKKILAFLIIILSILLWIFIVKNYPLECFSLKLGKKGAVPNNTVTKTDTPVIEGKCAKAGEEPVSNFDLRTGKTDPSVEIIPCCEGLQSIEKKQRNEHPIIERLLGSCTMYIGVPNQICSPCGNSVCDVETEDYCSCKEDCK